MNCCQCQGMETLFDNKTAANDLKSYRKKGRSKTTQMLVDALNKAENIEGLTLLDIGGGVGAIQHELLNRGAGSATGVDASAAYIEAARQEAGRQGHADRVSYHHGNFVDLAPTLDQADIVTLDRAICCYHDMPALVGLSSQKAGKLYGVVYPRDTWWTRIGITILNFGLWLRRNPFRTFVHPTEAVEAVVRDNGLERHFYRRTFLWQVAVFTR